MKRILFITLAVVLVFGSFFAGCGEPEETTTPATTSPTTTVPTTTDPVTTDPVTTPATTTVPTTTVPTTTTPAGPQPEYGGVLKLGTTSSLPPVTGYMPKFGFGNIAILQPCIESLLLEDAAGMPLPNLAESWDLDPSEKFIDFQLKKGVKFHDDTDFDAAAVKYHLDLRLEFSPGSLSGVTSVEVIDDYNIRLNLEFFSSSLYSALKGPAGYIVSPAQLAKGEAEANAHPVGTGAFKFVEMKRDAFIKFERFDDYWDEGKPYLDGIEYIVIPDAMTAMAAFQTGEIDAISPPAKEASELVAMGYPWSQVCGSYHGLAFDTVNPDSIYGDIRVRQAVEYAIDKELIVDTLGYGAVEALNQYCHQGAGGYNPDITGRSYDPDKAIQLLKEAGYPNGFKTDIYLYSSFDNDMAAAIQSQLLEVGIDANIEFGDSGRMADYRKNGWNGMLQIMHGGSVGNMAGVINRLWGRGVTDYVRVAKPDGFEYLLDAAMAAPDPDTRISLIQELLQLSFDEAMWVPLWANHSTWVWKESLNDATLGVIHSSWWTPADAWLSK